MVIAPVNTLKNWQEEFNKWTPNDLKGHTNVTVLAAETNSSKDKKATERDRLKKLRTWHTEGGVLIVGYNLFQRLVGTEEGTGNGDDENDDDDGGRLKSKKKAKKSISRTR